eukprot:TRINITY_DN30162_c0_g1_i1.p1 TRINITY_DN30162_c0_g1~~TRINITY_DN30162_c0_g1_i1.p1  ORF type:complete len:213 (+),score=40.53 TRINITY_DN30162_c0_g1_i1:111-749(+)
MAAGPTNQGGPISEWRVHAPAKSSRRRIVCPTSTGETQRSLPHCSPERSSSSLSRLKDDRALQAPRQSMPLPVGVRLMYFSRDGQQADTGDMIELQVSTSTTVEALLRCVRQACGCGEKGKLLFKMRPLTDASATLEMCGIPRDPKGLHLMLSRKNRPPEIADRAATVAAELSSAMEAAAAEAAARGPRQKREPRPPSGGSVNSAASHSGAA